MPRQHYHAAAVRFLQTLAGAALYFAALLRFFVDVETRFMRFAMMRTTGLLLCAAMLSTQWLSAQSFTATYDFAGVVSGAGGRTDPSTRPSATGVSFGAFAAVEAAGNPFGLSANPNATGRFSFTGWPTGASNGSDVFSGAPNYTQYYEVTLTPQAGFTFSISSISFTVQRSGTGIRQYAVRSSVDGFSSNLPASISPANAALSVQTGNVMQLTDASTTAQAGSTCSPGLSHADLSAPVTFRFYGFYAEGSAGTFSIDNVVFGGSADAVGSKPVLNLSNGSLGLPATTIGSVSASSSYTLGGTGLTGLVAVSTAAPFSISADNSSFGTSLNLSSAEVAVGKTIYVRFAPTAGQAYSGQVQHSSAGAVVRSLSLSGQGVDPGNLTFDFNACTVAGQPGSGFTQFSSSGAQLWNCTSFGRNNTNGVQMNGFSAGAQLNEDWLISPALNLSAGFNIPVLRFYSRTEFSGPAIEVLASTNYSGTGDPAAATWTPLPASLPIPASNTWTLTDNVDLSAFKQANVYIAFRYRSSPADGAARWTLDDVSIANANSLLSATPAQLLFAPTAVGSSSAAQTLTVRARGLGDLQVQASAGYQLSADNSSFFSNLNLSATQAEAGVPLYVRYSPVEKKLRDTGRLRISATGVADSAVALLLASSYPRSQTLDVATWNMTFFGNNSSNNATPAYREQQKQNAKTVINRLEADVIGVQEISSDSVWNVLLSEMPGYAAVLSPRWSRSFDAPDPNFPPQKVGFLYNTASMTLLSARAMFEGVYDAARGGANTLPSYPSPAGPSAFWASGRLPFMASFSANIAGSQRTVHVVVIHAKSGSASAEDYNRRVYDARVLKDSLDTYYAGEPVIVLGDFNDDMLTSTFGGQPSPYRPFATDAAGYQAYTQGFSAAGRTSFVGSTNSMIDHLLGTNELNSAYLAGSAEVEDPRTYISNYTSTTSDHLPVYVRYALEVPLPVAMSPLQAWLQGSTAQLRWHTLTEQGSSHFVIERSSGQQRFVPVGALNARGQSSTRQQYQWTDAGLAPGVYSYRLKAVDRDGSYRYSNQVTLRVGGAHIVVYPNPVKQQLQVVLPAGVHNLRWSLASATGRQLAAGQGSAGTAIPGLQQAVQRLKPGLYLLQLHTELGPETIKLLKE